MTSTYHIRCFPPVSSLIYGHLSQLWSADSYSKQLRKWSLQYGSIYGLFEGFRPVYVVSDLEFIQEVFISQFTRFCARRMLFIHRMLGDRQLNVFGARSIEQWTRQRRILNPTYSISKMKQLLPTLESCTDIFIEKLTSTISNEIINIQEFYLRLSMDIICRTAFGIKTDVQNDLNDTNIYLKKMKEMSDNDLEYTFLGKIHRIISTTQLANICTYLFRFKQWINWGTPTDVWFSEHIHQLVQPRFKQINQEHTLDLLQLMIDAVHSEKEGKLTPSEMFSNASVFLTAGAETTSISLAYCTYRLARHSTIQEEIYNEINNFIREVFRMHPIAIQVLNRECMENTRIGQYNIEKGSLIQVDLHSINFNQDLWGFQSVDEFHPERHLDKRHPLANMGFGAGPRQCIGMRFALMEIKSCLTRLIKEYNIKPTGEEPYKLNIHEKFLIMPEKVCVRLVKRS
ncbi:unnamed protein product [Adineta steineri]|uniref:Cytochrome P450 n=1 Tax=Adineta steineri TaxID=433720 RepID=A0A814JXC7_9BILA|nr:unnamed protein product [Adineta steineri]CAF1119831.1 unnamed protein product [Adineta steineri]